MSLVEYSSSEENEEASSNLELAPVPSPSGLKRKRDSAASDMPPLPAMFHDLYASATRASTRDDPSLHGGRKRITPHIEGNWPSHVYIECESIFDIFISAVD